MKSQLSTAKEVEKTLSVEYNTKINSYGIPDPFLLKNGWLKEESGICNWPPTSYPEIFNFLSFHPSELANNDLSDYKTSKAYSYYANGWLDTLEFNEINQVSSIVFTTRQLN